VKMYTFSDETGRTTTHTSIYWLLQAMFPRLAALKPNIP